MIQSRKNYIYYIWALKEYIILLCGLHYPTEIIRLIIMSTYTPIKISCGDDFTTCVVDNKIYTWGNNNRGQLGVDKDLINQNHIYVQYFPCELDFHKKIVSISCGEVHTMCLVQNSATVNKLYIWGCHADNQYRKKPYKLVLSNIKEICCGGFYSIALSRTIGKLYVWGSNNCGQLGIGYVNHIEQTPQELQFSEGIKSVSCGGYHTIALTSDPNKFYVWGGNYAGQLGLGHNYNVFSPKKLILCEPTVAVSCGANHTIALTTQGELYVWGSHREGQLGLGYSEQKFYVLPQKLVLPEKIKSVACGNNHTLVLATSGMIYVWGRNMTGPSDPSGQLGLGDCINRFTPHKLILKNIREICCGGGHTLALTADDQIYAWGCNRSGELGLGDCCSQSLPHKVEF